MSEKISKRVLNEFRLFPKSIRFLKNPPYEIKKIAVEQDAHNIKYIEPQTLELAKIAYKKNPSSSKHFNLKEIFRDMPEEVKVYHKLIWKI